MLTSILGAVLLHAAHQGLDEVAVVHGSYTARVWSSRPGCNQRRTMTGMSSGRFSKTGSRVSKTCMQGNRSCSEHFSSTLQRRGGATFAGQALPLWRQQQGMPQILHSVCVQAISNYLLDSLQELGLGRIASLDGLIQGLRRVGTQEVSGELLKCTKLLHLVPKLL